MRSISSLNTTPLALVIKCEPAEAPYVTAIEPSILFIPVLRHISSVIGANIASTVKKSAPSAAIVAAVKYINSGNKLGNLRHV